MAWVVIMILTAIAASMGLAAGIWIGYGRGVKDTTADMEGQVQAAEIRALKAPAYIEIPDWTAITTTPPEASAVRDMVTAIADHTDQLVREVRDLIDAHPLRQAPAEPEELSA